MERNRILYIKLAYKVYGFKKQCEICKSLEKICVHHKDKNPGNNSKDNLQILCKSCHTSLHSFGRKFKHKEETKIIIGLLSKGRKHSEETKRKISNASKNREYRKGYKQSKELIEKRRLGNLGKIRNNKKINQYNLNGNFIKTRDSIGKINKELGIKLGTIYWDLKLNRDKSGFIFKYY